MIPSNASALPGKMMAEATGENQIGFLGELDGGQSDDITRAKR